MTTNGSRAENAKRVACLHAQGLNGTQIAKRLGLSVSYTYGLLSDPDGHEARERKLNSGGVCIRCGGRTDGSKGRAYTPDLCGDCYRETGWTRERIIAAINQWADEHGGIPPASLHWGNLNRYHPDFRPGEYPCADTVAGRFGTWNQALEVAGYEPHMRRDPGRYTDTVVRGICDRITNGESAVSISREMGLCDGAVGRALSTRGITAASLRNAA